MPELEAPLPYESAAFDLDPKALLNAMRFRRSIRQFTGEKVTREELELLLEAGRCAPTSSNSQSVGFTVLDQEFETLRPRIWKSFARLAREGGRGPLAPYFQATRGGLRGAVRWNRRSVRPTMRAPSRTSSAYPACWLPRSPGSLCRKTS